MGKGGYNGGSTVVGFSGSGWVGRGSVTMQPSTKKGQSTRSGGKTIVKARPIAIPAALAGDEEVQRLGRRVKAIEADLKAARSRMTLLTRQLQLASDQLRAGIDAKALKPKPKPRTKMKP